MTLKLRSPFTFLILLALFTNTLKAQPRVGQSVNVSIGFASSSSYYIEDYGRQDEVDTMGSGLALQGEYIFGITSWFGLRPYAGAIFTSTSNNPDLGNQPQYKVNTNAFLVGGKIRICAPIPWVAPFIEGGVGLSAGKFQTFTPAVNFDKSDVLLHIPFSIGLAVGRKNNIEIAISGYFHPAAKQSTGIFGAGFTFPVD